MMDEIARDTPGIVRVLDKVPQVRFPVWLVTHRELRTSRRIRVVFDALAKGLAKYTGGAIQVKTNFKS
jgi:DNA-binding transcriptional LysR family regulator